ncbi:hypothetical protein M436DRAFT_78618 [Aureobasidium namibiae CBS 147.97]|uniref:SRR1-like domain-containing protein n=1 Tax=Aureobasidium namibiae CBS 147.97 TaxID=1043004 RepID=A0A074X4B8_9PEZI
MDRVPRDEPENLFPLPENSLSGNDSGLVGINEEDWERCIDDWYFGHKAFRRRAITANGQPADGYFPTIWKEVKDVQKLLTEPLAPETHIFDPTRHAREQLREVVGRTATIKTAVFMGLGNINWQCKTDYNRSWVQQCGLFLAICQLLEEKQGKESGSIKKFFQDPSFEMEDRWILERIGKQVIIEHPAANDKMGKGSFIFAPRFPANYMFDTFLIPGRKMDLLLTNTIHGSLGTITWPIVDDYFNEVYWSGNTTITPGAQRMYGLAKAFLDNHEGLKYWGAYSSKREVMAAYAKFSFYLPRTRPSGPAASLLIGQGSRVAFDF